MADKKSIVTIYGTLDNVQLSDLKGALEEIVGHMTEIKKYQSWIKDIVDTYAENTQLPKKIIKKMANTMFKDSFQNEVSEFKEFEDLLEVIQEID